MKILTFQPKFDKPIPEVIGNKLFSDETVLLRTINEILVKSKIETFVAEHFIALRKIETGKKYLKSSKTQQLTERAGYAIRASILRKLLGLSLRDFTRMVAHSSLYQWFIGINRFLTPKIFSKSTLADWEYSLPKKLMDTMNILLAKLGAEPSGILGDNPACISKIYADTTCVKANIHRPVDWKTLADAARTLMLSVHRIRESGIINRMPCSPKDYLSKMNTLSIQMAQHRRRKGAKKKRKKTYRAIRDLLKNIVRHAIRHRDSFDERWQETEFSRTEVDFIINNMNKIIEQVDAIIRIAHERIIGERRVKNDDKILSLYEPDIHVNIRGKSGAEVEFGNTLLIVETDAGLILDCRLEQNKSPGDAVLLRESMGYLLSHFEKDAIKLVCGDRGFDAPAVREMLADLSAFNAIAARSVPVFIEQMDDDLFRRAQKRRAQTEGRIGIFKNCFLGSPMVQKGFEHRDIHVGIGLLAHNLWKLARMVIAGRDVLSSAG